MLIDYEKLFAQTNTVSEGVTDNEEVIEFLVDDIFKLFLHIKLKKDSDQYLHTFKTVYNVFLH